MSWLEKFTTGIATTTTVASIIGVSAEPGWNVIGTIPIDGDMDARLDLIGSVSDASLELTCRLYCVTPGAVGEVPGSRSVIDSTTEARAFSSRCKLTAGCLYQVQAQVVGGEGDDYFGFVRRATPVPFEAN